MKIFKWISLLFLFTPLAAEPFIVAHRGASHDAPENTLPAFKLAWEQGADAIEGDFHLTRDGHVICLHDHDTKRTAGVKRIVKNSSLEELQKLDVGKWKDLRFAGTRIPTFAEVAATVPTDKSFYIEVKCGAEIVPKLLEEIRISKLKHEQIVVISFSSEVLRELKRHNQNIRAIWLSSFKKSNPLDPSMGEILKTLDFIKADGFSSKADKRLTSDFLAPLRVNDFEYHCWTVDDPNVAQKFLLLGTQSITTNRPAFLRKALKRD